MAIYRIRFRASARRDFAKLPSPMKVRIGRAIEGLAQQPRPAGAQLLSGSTSPTWRIRVGDYRVLYEIHDDQLVVLVVAAGHRREVEPKADRPQPHGGKSWTRETFTPTR